MQRTFHQYNLTTELAKKYSHSTYLASPINDPEHQVVLIAFDSSLSFAFPRERESLLQKAQFIKKLQHPHLLPILDMGIEEEQPFVVRDYLSNGSLRSRLKKLSPQRLELWDALNIVLQVGEALAYAHEHNILHGNVKPENILFDANGQALLTDFTLASRTDAMLRNQTLTEYAFSYMAPEQLAGTWDARSDQYAMGCLTYELITGNLPFAAQTLTSIMGQHNNAQPIPLSERIPHLSSSLEAAVLKTLAKEPNERFFDFLLFLEVIRSVLSPPPSFPILRSATSHKQMTTSRFIHSPKARTFLSSLRQPVVSPSPTPEAPEIFALFNAEHDLAEPVDASTAVNARMETMQQSEDLISKIAMTPQTSEKHADDLWLTNLFGEQERNYPPATVSANLGHEQYKSEIDEVISALPQNTERDIPLTRRTQSNRGKLLGLIFLCLVITASGIYAALLSFRASKPDMPVHPTPAVVLRVIPAIKSVSVTQPAVLASPMTTAQPTQQNKATPQVISTPTLTPTPTPVVLRTTTIDDSIQGTGTNQFNYVGNGWGHCTDGCNGDPLPPNLYDGSNSWDNTTNDYVTITFSGTQIKFYGVVGPPHGIGAFSIDGGSETMLDFYAPTQAGNTLLYTSPVLPAGQHTLKVRVTGNQSSQATWNGINPDRVDILSRRP